jgi:predicted ATP-grasp superfamily ATP-dependent carboligase
MKPSGEYVQPEISDFIAVVRDFAKLHSGYKIFVVTEDGSIYETLKKEFRETLVTASFDTFIYDYSGREFLSKSQVLNEDRKKRGIDYLVKIALLAKCRFLVTSITMGSMFAFGLNGGKYEDYYVFDLGLYP